MSQIDNRSYLREHQYRDASNLEKRSNLHELFSTNPTGWFRWVADHLQLPEQAQILEVGAGPGGLWLSQGSRLPAGWQVTLSDFSPGMMKQGRERLANAQRSYRFGVWDVQNLPFPMESFDGVIANHMLYHVPDRPRALAEIRRVLKPGGKLFAATNGKDHMRELDNWIAQAADLSVEELERRFWGGRLGFNLENGRAQLEQQFSAVELLRYSDALEVTEAEPLMEYVASMTRVYDQPKIQNALERLRELWEGEIRAKGSVHISKDSGLFLAESVV